MIIILYIRYDTISAQPRWPNTHAMVGICCSFARISARWWRQSIYWFPVPVSCVFVRVCVCVTVFFPLLFYFGCFFVRPPPPPKPSRNYILSAQLDTHTVPRTHRENDFSRWFFFFLPVPFAAASTQHTPVERWAKFNFHVGNRTIRR